MIMWRNNSLIIGVMALMCGVPSPARASDIPPRQLKPDGDVMSTTSAPTQVQPLRIDMFDWNARHGPKRLRRPS